MAQRITRKDLDGVVARINRLLDMPATPYTHTDGKCVANIGNYHISGAYGGWAVHRMATDGGGITDVFRIGHVPARELYTACHAFIAGIEHGDLSRK